jgi:hypothetical protein
MIAANDVVRRATSGWDYALKLVSFSKCDIVELFSYRANLQQTKFIEPPFQLHVSPYHLPPFFSFLFPE